MNYAEWMKSVPRAVTEDSLWRMSVYRLALFLGEVAWHDVTKLAKDLRMRELSDQLYRAVGSISANVAEGYSRGTGRDRARFYEYALGSAREARDWYFKGRHVLGENVNEHRINLLAEIIRLLLAMVPDQRGAMLREDQVPYQVEGEMEEPKNLAELLNQVPLADA
ncbi:MAG: four helix bundle protein [Verrucomicrobia bacterium]|nr:four helix bundle protein [Verrucomicrobiota bacterium]